MSIKQDRLQIRVDEVTKRLLEDAAEATQLTVSAFVLQAAVGRAGEIAAERSLIRLAPEAAAAFARALARPGRVNERLAAALSRRRKFSWL